MSLIPSLSETIEILAKLEVESKGFMSPLGDVVPPILALVIDVLQSKRPTAADIMAMLQGLSALATLAPEPYSEMTVETIKILEDALSRADGSADLEKARTEALQGVQAALDARFAKK